MLPRLPVTLATESKLSVVVADSFFHARLTYRCKFLVEVVGCRQDIKEDDESVRGRECDGSADDGK